jgi:hypothetical protein
MAKIQAGDFTDLTDKIAGACDVWETYVGKTTPVAGSIAYKINEDCTSILALADRDQVRDLLPGFDDSYNDSCLAAPSQTLFEDAINALNNHVDGIDDYCDSNSIRVAPEFARCANAITTGMVTHDYIFPPAYTNILSVEVTGASTCATTAGTAIDTSLYSEYAPLIVRAISSITSETTAILTLQVSGGTTATRAVVLTTGASQRTFDVGTHYDDMYYGCINCTVTGGTASNTFRVESERERALT